MKPPSVVLVTGSSRGIGRSTCERLVRAGYIVYASARRMDTIDDLASVGCHLVRLDVTDEVSMRAAIETIENEVGRIDVVVNNAGYGIYGPVEQVALDEVRAEFETNVFGLIRLCQLVLPAMRAQGSGRIINISSVAGRTTFPGGAAYHASKYALESFTDALRVEVAQFNIGVVLVEPGPVSTDWAHQAANSIPLGVPDIDDPYERLKSNVAATLLSRETGMMRLMNSTSSDVARIIHHAIAARHPRARYSAGSAAILLNGLRRFIPDAVFDALVRRRFDLG